MANIYVRSAAAGAGTGADWANAYTTLAAAMTGGANGDDFWVADDHAETQASTLTITCKGTSASPCRVMCVDRAGTVPPVAADLRTTATISNTGAFNYAINAGTVYFRGITFSAAGGGANAANLQISATAAEANHTYDNCVIKMATTSGVGGFLFGFTSAQRNACKITFINTVLNVNSTGQKIRLSTCTFVWKGTSSALAGASVPSDLFSSSSTEIGHTAYLQGVDLSAMTSGGTCTLVNGVTQASKYVFQDCKLGSGVVVAAGAAALGGQEVYLNRCDSGATVYRQEKHTYAGAETMETTIVRTGGATIQGTAVAKKIVTTANAKFLQPFESTPLVVANQTTGVTRTVTVYGIWGGGAVPNNDDVWMEVGYLGSAATPLATIATTAKATPLTTAAGNASDTSTWGGSTTKFKLVATLSSPAPALPGEMWVKIYVGAASATVYIDPKVIVS